MTAAPLLLAALLPAWQDSPPGGDAPPAAAASLERRAVAALDGALDAPLAADLAVMPGDTLAAALDTLFEGTGVIWRGDRQALELDGLSLDDIVLENPLPLPAGRFSVRKALEELLSPVEVPLTYLNDGGVLAVTTVTEAEDRLTTRLYEVRDVLEANAVIARAAWTPRPPLMGGHGGSGIGGGTGAGGFGGGAFSIGAAQHGGGASLGVESVAKPLSEPTERPTLAQAAVGGYQPLIDLIVSTTGGPDNGGEWEDDGGFGTIEEFNGALVIRQTDAVHRQVARLLADLRSVGGGMAWRIAEPDEPAPNPEAAASVYEYQRDAAE